MDLLRILDGTPEPPIVDLELTDINDSGEYTIATPVYEFQRELTDQIISLHYSDILKYCETNDKTELIVKSLEICIQNCTLVCSHPYLLITHYMPKNLLQRDMALKLAETSGKFNVLKDLINVMCMSCESIYGVPRMANSNSPKKRGQNPGSSNGATANHKHIGIVLSNINKLVDLVEALLIGNVTRPFKLKRYVGNYLRRDHKKNEPSNANITVHLIPGDFKDMKQELASIKFDFIIKLDELVPDDYVSRLRIQNRPNPCNTIKLIPMLSIEHCKIFYHGQQEDPRYLYKLISSIVCLRDQIGILPPDIFPIYNQGLNYLLGFFNEAFKNDIYPIWPLPNLAKIPNFTAIDVEKSLLTEVNFHYTPYDNDINNDNEEKVSRMSNKKPKKTYYELNRLQLNYITNPLTNDFDKLLGIFNHNIMEDKQVNYLTHKLLTQINNLYMEYEVVQQEYEIFTQYNTDSVQEKVGRRYLELNRTSSNLVGDIDHVTSRIKLGNKKFNKRIEEIEEIKKDIEGLKNNVEDFASREDVKAFDEKVTLVKNQIKIWELTTSVKDNIAKIKSKQDEKNYMKSEFENSVKSIKESKATITELKELNENLHKRYNTFKELDNEELKNFRVERNKLLAKIEKSRQENSQLKEKLTKSFRYLRDSSHLKKRKIRGITPK